jgi:hypothetical protein
MNRTTNRYVSHFFQTRKLGLMMLVLLVVVWAPGISPVQSQSPTPTPTPSPTPSGPGATDPMKQPGNYLLFRNDNFFVAGQAASGPDSDGYSTPGYHTLRASANPTGSTLTGFNVNPLNIQWAQDFPNANKRVVGGAGRILSPDADQGVIFKLYDFDPSSWNPNLGEATYYLQIFDGNETPFLYETSFDPVGASLTSHLDVAVGDLDRLRNKDGNYQDEVVLVSEVDNIDINRNPEQWQTMQLTVISFLNGASAPLITSINTGIEVGYYIDPPYGCTVCDQYDKAGQISVAAGDFDGDGIMEIVTTTISIAGEVALATYRYENDGNGNAQLVQAYTNYDYQSKSVRRQFGFPEAGYQYADVEAGDFNDDGRDEIMVGWVGGSRNGWVHCFGVDDKLQVGPFLGALTLGPGNNGVTDEEGVNSKFNEPGWVQIKAGLFKWDPNNGYGTRRRQLGVIWGNSRPVFGVLELPIEPAGALYWLDNPGGVRNTGGAGPYDVDFALGNGYFIGIQNFGFAVSMPDVREAYTFMAGKFGGYDPQQPNWHLAVSAPAFTGSPFPQQPSGMMSQALTYNVVVWEYSGGLTPGLQVPTNLSFSRPTAWGQNIAAVALDLDGKSLRLGAPMHITIENMVKTDFILQEPPKHAFYDNNPQSPTYGQIITVSRFDETNVAMTNKEGTSFSSEGKSTTDWSIGGSLAASAEESVSVGEPDVEGVQLSVGLKAQVGYDYDSKSEDYNSSYKSTSITVGGSTQHDDLLQGQFQNIDIWRYRVYGANATDAQGNPTNAFYDLVLPGGTKDFNAVGGLNFDGYQPTYENGNILSYPAPGDVTFTPEDLGSYEIPCPSQTDPLCTPCTVSASDPACGIYGKKTISATPFVPAALQFFGGTAGQIQFETTSETDVGGTFSYTKKLDESLDLKVGYKATATEGVVSFGQQYALDINLHNSNSWGEVQTHSSKTTTSTGITLSRSSGDPSQSYPFYSVFYPTKDGTIKVAHAVPNPADQTGNAAGFNFWADIYGGKPDPALNLPQRFSPLYSSTNALIGWQPNPVISRKRMRGFFLREAKLDPVTNDYDYLADTPVAGDQVRVEARVYNYSTGKPANDLVVRFQAAPYDAATDTETGPRVTIGDARVSLDSLAMTTAFVIWDTTNFGPATPDATAQYRIYVVLDPENEIDEIYDTEDPNKSYQCKVDKDTYCQIPKGLDPGQNNEGFGYASVKHASVGADPRAQFEADVYLRDDALAATNHLGSVRTKDIPAQIFRPLTLRAKVYNDRVHAGIGHLLVYDGDPEQGGELIANKKVDTGDVHGSHVWFEWIPRTIGPHKLYAKLLERLDDAKPGNHTATMKINVVPADTTPPQLSLALSPNRLRPPDEQMVRIRAAIAVLDNQDRQPDVRLEAITHNEANDASADVAGAEFGTYDRTFRLRAVSSGASMEGRIYEVVYSVTDWAGNKTFAKAYVRIPHDRRKKR